MFTGTKIALLREGKILTTRLWNIDSLHAVDRYAQIDLVRPRLTLSISLVVYFDADHLNHRFSYV